MAWLTELALLTPMSSRADRRPSPVLKWAALWLMVALSAPATAGVSEDELTALEKKDSDFHPADVMRLATLNYHVRFALAFQGAQAQSATPASDSAPPDGLKMTTKVLDGARAINAIAVGLPNSIHNPLDTKLITVSIALSVIDLFRKKPVSDAQLQKQSWSSVQDHSFFLVHVMPKREGGTVESEVERVFTEGQSFLRGSDLACTTAMERQPAAKPGTLGEFIPGRRHLRLMLCDGTDTSQTMSVAALRREAVDLVAQPMPKGKGKGKEVPIYDDGVYGLIVMTHLDQRDHVRHLVNPTGAESSARYGRLVYERVKDRIPNGWLAVFSETSPLGATSISVGDGKHDITLEMPPLP